MIKPAAVVLLLCALALVARLDRDGVLAGSGVVAQALGIEVRVDVRLQRTCLPPDTVAVGFRDGSLNRTAEVKPCE